MKRTKHILLAVFVLILASLACNAVLPQAEPTSVPTQVPTRVLVPTQVTEPASTQPAASLPQTDAQVSRVPPDQAKTALDRGDAIIVDVRGAAAYAQKHITGALEISLGAIELDPTNLNLDKNKWIITYCT
jgi:hypothetical protein